MLVCESVLAVVVVVVVAEVFAGVGGGGTSNKKSRSGTFSGFVVVAEAAFGF